MLIGLVIGLIEVVALTVGGDWIHGWNTVVVVAIAVLLIGAHGGVAVAIDRGLRLVPHPGRLVIWCLFAAAFGWGWQDTMMHGDGVRSFAYYDVLRVVSGIAGPIAVVAWVGIVGFVERVPLIARRVLAALAVVVGLVLTQTFLLAYDALHGYLVLFVAANTAWLLRGVLRGRVVAALGALLMLLAGSAIIAVPNWSSGQRATQAGTEIGAALLSLPWTEPLQLPPESVLNPDATFTSQSIESMRRSFSDLRAELDGEPRGENVLLIVLESTRADSWENPEIAPRFHKWKKHGLYVPRAVAQYPATPLAYGAMFTAQPPSVLTQTPQWAKSRLFDRLSKRFDHLLLSRPNNGWFDRGAITDFFVPRDADVRKHSNVKVGLRSTRQRLEKVPDGESFFAWVHIYEPHQPWKLRKRFADKNARGWRASYESEVRYMDDELGKFMDWFFTKPIAKDTLVIVIADHGEGIGERIEGKRFAGHHVHVRNVVSHIPAFFAGPGVPAGVTKDLPIAQLDVMPTMFDFLGEELPAETLSQGRSLFAVLDDPKPRDLVTEAFSIRGAEFFDFVQEVRESKADEARARFSEVASEGKYAPKIGLQYGRYKLIRNMLLQQTEMYDIEADPDEKTDISAEQPKKFEELEQRLADWRERQSWVVRQFEARPIP